MKLFYTLSIACFCCSCVIAQVPTEGLIAWYPFNDNANDESGNGINGQVFGAFTADDRFGNSNAAYEFFDLDSSYIYLGCENALSANYISISFWVNIPDYIGTGNGVMIRSRYYGWGLSLDQNILNANAYIADNLSINLDGYYTIEDNDWHHIVFSMSDCGAQLYIDKVLVADAPDFNNIYYVYGCVAFGRDGDNAGSYFSGQLDDVRFYNRCLTTGEINALFDEESGVSTLELPTQYIGITPNPASDEVVVQLPLNTTNGDLIIYNTLGETVQKYMHIQGTQVTVNTSILPAGIYIVQYFEKGNITAAQKIVIQG